MSRLAAGEKVQLEPGYEQAYAQWAEQNNEVRYQWGPAKCTEEFEASLEKTVHEQLLGLIEQKAPTEEEKKNLQELENRGQLLLVSTDEGKTFDQFLTPKEVAQANPLNYRVLSPTFRSVTTNLKEVLEEQTLLHVVATLKENFKAPNGSQKELWTIEDAFINKGVVHVKIKQAIFANTEASENEQYHEVEVQVEQGTDGPLLYNLIDEKGKKKKTVSEDNLSHEYGQAQPDQLLNIKPEDLLLQQTIRLQKEVSEDEDKEKIYAAALSTWAAMEGMKHATAEQQAAELAAIQNNKQGELKVPVVTNVMNNKAVVAERNNAQNHEHHEQERSRQAKKMSGEIQRQSRATQIAQKNKLNATQKSLLKGTGLAASIGAGLFGLLTGTTLFVTHITLFT